MTGLVYLNTTTLSARKTLTGIEVPVISCRLQAQFALEVGFFATGDTAPELLSSPTFRVAIKGTPTGSPFVLTSTAEEQESTYLFNFASVDSTALRTAIGDLPQLSAYGEVEWTVSGEVQRVSFPVVILNAYIRSGDSAPDPAAEESDAWLIEQLASRVTAGGYLKLQNADGDWFHIPLNSGLPPS